MTTKPLTLRACDAELELPRGTTKRAVRLGAPTVARNAVCPEAVKAWLAATKIRLAPLELSQGWALLKPKAVRALARLADRSSSGGSLRDCRDCLAGWLPSERWKRHGEHYRARVRLSRVKNPKSAPREHLIVQCGACFSTLARISLLPFAGLVDFTALPRAIRAPRSRVEHAIANELATMGVATTVLP